jgi:hypothetical protein
VLGLKATEDHNVYARKLQMDSIKHRLGLVEAAVNTEAQKEKTTQPPT